MILASIIFLACSDPKIVNDSHEMWSKDDQDMYIRYRNQCKYEYLDAPCLRKFIKYDHKSYFVICGAYDKQSTAP